MMATQEQNLNIFFAVKIKSSQTVINNTCRSDGTDCFDFNSEHCVWRKPWTAHLLHNIIPTLTHDGGSNKFVFHKQ